MYGLDAGNAIHQRRILASTEPIVRIPVIALEAMDHTVDVSGSPSRGVLNNLMAAIDHAQSNPKQSFGIAPLKDWMLIKKAGNDRFLRRGGYGSQWQGGVEAFNPVLNSFELIFV